MQININSDRKQFSSETFKLKEENEKLRNQNTALQ